MVQALDCGFSYVGSIPTIRLRSAEPNLRSAEPNLRSAEQGLFGAEVIERPYKTSFFVVKILL